MYFPCLFPRSWHSAAKTLAENPITELHCGGMGLGCCVSQSIWTWKLYKHEGQIYKRVFLWRNIVYQAPYDPEEKDMSQEEYSAHEAAAWAFVESIPHPPHIGYASLQQKEDEQRRQQWEWNRFMRVY